MCELHTVQTFLEGVSDRLVVHSSVKQDLNFVGDRRLNVTDDQLAISVKVWARLQICSELAKSY